MQNYNAAQRIRELAKEHDAASKIDLLKNRALAIGELVPVDTPGYLRTSAAIMFDISLEALINTLYFYQLKEEYRRQT